MFFSLSPPSPFLLKAFIHHRYEVKGPSFYSWGFGSSSQTYDFKKHTGKSATLCTLWWLFSPVSILLVWHEYGAYRL